MSEAVRQTSVFPYILVVGGRSLILLWATSSARDSFLLDAAEDLLVAGTLGEANSAFSSLPFDISWSEASTLDFDCFWKVLAEAVNGRETLEDDCDLLLNGWNVIEDLLRTFELADRFPDLRSPLVNRAYSKLFWGNNLEPVTPADSGYQPIWEDGELRAVEYVLQAAWSALGERTKFW